eukprot:8912890-Prorocentrum_lima.AAC.1
MTSSLVGSEMCIRDSLQPAQLATQNRCPGCHATRGKRHNALPRIILPVSYTHLTLPTICSV